MSRALPRTNFNTSRLIRFLADLSIADPAESKQAFAERLGQWLDFSDAITLHASHNAAAAAVSSTATPGLRSATPDAIADELARTRSALASAISKNCSPEGGEARLKLPVPRLGPEPSAETIELAAAYEPFHRFYIAQQRDLELNLRPLRIRARDALAKASPALRQLAALDLALDEILLVRERKLLATVPLLLEKRFERLRQAHRQTLAATQQADNPAGWMQAGGWLAVFCTELQSVLLAELDVRLQPSIGLIEAFSNEANKQQ